MQRVWITVDRTLPIEKYKTGLSPSVRGTADADSRQTNPAREPHAMQNTRPLQRSRMEPVQVERFPPTFVRARLTASTANGKKRRRRPAARSRRAEAASLWKWRGGISWTRLGWAGLWLRRGIENGRAKEAETRQLGAARGGLG